MNPETRKSFANHQLVTLALFLCGGGAKAADLEDVAIKVNDLAPGRFTWRKHPDQINIKNVHAALRDAKKTKNGNLVIKVERDQWTLTEAGGMFARTRIQDLKGADVARTALSVKEKNWIRLERERMISSEAFAKFEAKKSETISPQEAESFFRVDAYVVGEARAQKILRAKKLLGEDQELGPLIRLLEAKLEKGD